MQRTHPSTYIGLLVSKLSVITSVPVVRRSINLTYLSLFLSVLDPIPMDYFLMQDQQRTLFAESSCPSACGSAYATPSNNMDSINNNARHHRPYPAYFVDSPSTVVDMSPVSHGFESASERLTEPFSASLLSRSTSFLSNCTSEAVSMPDVSARLQSLCKARPVTNKWESSCDEELGGLGGEDEGTCSGAARCRDALKSFALWLCVTVLVTAFLLALSTAMYWLVCHPHAPGTTFKGLEFRRFDVLQGYDRTGVPTDMVSLESMVRLAVHNPSRHYGVYVTGAEVALSYLPRPIAHGQVRDFYQDCSSERDVVIKVKAEYVPLYGAGPSLKEAIDENRHIPLGLTVSVTSHVNLFGSLVKQRFTEVIACNVMLSPITGAVAATYCEPSLRTDKRKVKFLH